MKRYLTFLTLLCGVYAISSAQPQAHLRITNLINFPDTAFEGNSYQIGFQLKNVGSMPFQGPFQVLLQADSAVDIFYFNNNPNFALFPNDTVTLVANSNGVLGYVFDSTVFRPGNDVVVVWPYSTQMSVTYDTLYTAVYFVPINGIPSALPETEVSGFLLYPNPFRDIIWIGGVSMTSVEQVRIYDTSARLIYHNNDGNLLFLSLQELKSGFYFMEVTFSNQQKIKKKILKY